MLVVPLAASHIPDANLILNALMLFVVAFGAPRFFRAKMAEAREAEKDRSINTHEQTIRAQAEQIEQLSRQYDEARATLEECRTAAKQWEARYQEQSKYAAQEAFQHFETFMKQHSERVAERHEAMIAALRSNSELSMNVLAYTAAIGEKLGVDNPIKS